MGGVYLEGVSDGRRQGWLLFRTRGRLLLLSPGCWRRRPGAAVNEGAGSGLMPHVRLQISEHFPNRKEEGPSWIKTRGV